MSRATWATRAQFLLLGVVAGTWGVHVPSIKMHFGLDERMLSFVLLATSVGSVLTLFTAGRLIGRIGARNSSALAGAVFCGALATSLYVPGIAGLLLVMVALGAGESVFDVSINAEGTVIEAQTGRAVMSGFHGMFSLGAMLGASAAALMIRIAIPPESQLIGVGIGVGTAIFAASRGMLTAHPRADAGDAHFAWPTGALLVIGGLICAGMLAEGVMYNWSVLYVQQELRTPQDRAAMAYVAFAGATALTRFFGDAIRVRFPERLILLVGPMLAAVAMAVVLVIAKPWVAFVGFALVGAGLATIVPILYTAATRVPGVSRPAAIASVSSIGYLGFMVGPPIVGGIAHLTTLTMAMVTLIVATLILGGGARRVPQANDARR